MDPQIQSQFQQAWDLIQQEPDYGIRQQLAKQWQERFSEWEAADTPAGPAVAEFTGFEEIPYSATTKDTGERSVSTRFVPPEQRMLMEQENALKQAEALASTFQIPFIQKPAGVRKTTGPNMEAIEVEVPARIGYRPGRPSDLTAASNPFETYAIPQAEMELYRMRQQMSPQGAPATRPQGVPAMFFGEGLPPVPIQPETYMQAMDLIGRSRGQVTEPIDTTNLLDLARERFSQRPAAPTAVITPPVQRKPINSAVVQEAINAVGSTDRDAVAAWLSERGYEFE